MPNYMEAAMEPPPGSRFAIVVSRYNHTITDRLLDGALQTLAARGVADEHVDVARVPGAWERGFVWFVLARAEYTGHFFRWLRCSRRWGARPRASVMPQGRQSKGRALPARVLFPRQ